MITDRVVRNWFKVARMLGEQRYIGVSACLSVGPEDYSCAPMPFALDDLSGDVVWRQAIFALGRHFNEVPGRVPNYGFTAIMRYEDPDRYRESCILQCVEGILGEGLGFGRCQWLADHPLIPSDVFRHALVVSKHIPELERGKISWVELKEDIE